MCAVCPGPHAEAPCATLCTRQVYPDMADFTSCTECTSKKENIPYRMLENAGIEVVLTLHYSRRSQLLGAAQPTMVNAFVDLLQDRGIKVLCWPVFSRVSEQIGFLQMQFLFVKADLGSCLHACLLACILQCYTGLLCCNGLTIIVCKH